MEFKSKYTQEEITKIKKFLSPFLKEKGEITKGCKYNIWLVFNEIFDDNTIKSITSMTNAHDYFVGTIFNRPHTIFFYMPEFD